MGLSNPGSSEQRPKTPGGHDLARVRTRVVDLGPEGVGSPPQPLQRHGARDVGGVERAGETTDGQRPDAGRRLGAVDQRHRLLFGEVEGFDAGGAKHPGGLAPPSVRLGAALSHQRERDVGKGREIAAGADRPDLRHLRMDSVIQQIEQPLHDNESASRLSARQRVGAEQHNGADLRRGKPAAHPGCVAADQVALQGALLVGQNPHVGEPPEPGVDAVDRLTPAQKRLQAGARALYPLCRARVEADRDAVTCHRLDFRQGQPVSVDGDHGASARAWNSSRVRVRRFPAHVSSSLTPSPSARRFT